MNQLLTYLAAVLGLKSKTCRKSNTSPSAQSSSTQQAIDANPGSQKGNCKQPADASQSAGSSKRVTTGSGILGTDESGSDDPPNLNPRQTCFRISGIPLSWSENDLFDVLHTIDPFLTRQDYRPSLYPACYRSTQTALLNLDPRTEYLQRDHYMRVSESGSRVAAHLTIDSHFYNLTPLNAPVREVVAELAVRALEDT
jgi:hypothetical protein